MARKSERRTWSEWFRGDGKIKARKRLAVEILEDRSVPATVTNLLDGPDPFNPIQGSLRWAIKEALKEPGSVAVVDIPDSLVAAGPKTLILNGSVGQIVLTGSKPVTINGPQANRLTIQSDYGFTPGTTIDLSASPIGSRFIPGEVLRQEYFAAPASATNPNQTIWGGNPYFGGAVFTVGAVGPSGDILSFTINNGGSNAFHFNSPSITVPVKSVSGNSATLVIPNSVLTTNDGFSTNPGIFSLQFSSSSTLLTLNNLSLGATKGASITQNTGSLVINNGQFDTSDFFNNLTGIVLPNPGQTTFISTPLSNIANNISVTRSTFDGKDLNSSDAIVPNIMAIDYKSGGSITINDATATLADLSPAQVTSAPSPTILATDGSGNFYTASDSNAAFGKAVANLSTGILTGSAYSAGTATTKQLLAGNAGNILALQNDNVLRSFSYGTATPSSTVNLPGPGIEMAFLDAAKTKVAVLVGGSTPSLIIANYNAGTGILSNSTTLSLPAALNPVSIATGQFNDESAPRGDIAVLGQDGIILTYKGDATGGFSSPVASNLPAGSYSQIARLNLNGTVIDDIVATSATGLTTMLGSPTGGFTTPNFTPFALGATNPVPRGMTTGDLNGDGTDDVAVAFSNRIQVYYGRENSSGVGEGKLHANPANLPIVVPSTLAPTSIGLSDVNSDGKLDIVAALNAPPATPPNPDYDGVYVLQNLGADRFGPVTVAARTTFRNNSDGAVIATQSGAVNWKGAVFQNNGATSGTAISLTNATAITLNGVEYTSNPGSSNLKATGTLTVQDSLLSNNTAPFSLQSTGSTISFTNNRVTNNTATAPFSITANSTVAISNLYADNNNPGAIGDTRAIAVTGSTITISESVFTNHTQSGALNLAGNSTVSNSFFSNNAATANNLAANKGGAAIRSASGTLTVNKSAFDKNTYYLSGANSGGGAIYFTGGINIGLSVIDSSFENNAAVIGNNLYTAPVAPATYAGLSGGGAIRSGSSTSITRSLFANNAVFSLVDFWSPPAGSQGTPAYSGGGAVLVSSQNSGATSSTNQVFNTTFYQNSAVQLQAAPGTPYANFNLSGISVPALPGTGRGLTGGAILLADTPTTNSTTDLINTTIASNSVANLFATASNANIGANTNLANTTDSGGIFNDTRAGSIVRLVNAINVSNTGNNYNPTTGAPAFSAPANFGRRPTAPTAEAAFSLFNPATNSGLVDRIAGNANNLRASDQNSGLDRNGLLPDDIDLAVPKRTTAGTSSIVGPGNTNAIVRYILPDRLSPARDSGTPTSVNPFAGAPAIPANDVRGISRPVNGVTDMGAAELQSVTKITVDPATLPAGGTLEYGQTDDITVQVAFDDTIANPNPINGRVHLITKSGDKITGYYGTTDLASTNSITINGDISRLLTPGINNVPGSPNTFDLYALYEGSDFYSASLSDPFRITVNNPATTAISFDAGSLNFTDAPAFSPVRISLTGSVAVAHPGGAGSPANFVPTGTVQFSIKPFGSALPFTVLHSVPVFGGRFDSTNLPDEITKPNGVYIISADYIPTDPLQFAPTSKAIKQEVGITPGITVSVAANTLTAGTVQRGDLLTVTATLNIEDTDTNQPGSITITKDGVDLLTIPRIDATSGGSDPTKRGVYAVSIDTGDPLLGFDVSGTPYVLSARYNRLDSGIYTTTTAATSQSITVIRQNTSAGLTVTTTSGGNTVAYGETFYFETTVSPGVAGSIIPFGTSKITFNDSFNGAAQVPLAPPLTISPGTPPVAGLTLLALATGSHVISASYDGDINYAPSGSNTVTILVTKASTSSSVIASPANGIVTPGSPGIFTIQVATPVQSGNSGISRPTGSVVLVSLTNPTIHLQSTFINANGIATLSYTPAVAGTHDLRLIYSGDDNYSGSSVDASIIAPALALDLGGSDPASTVRGAPVSFSATVSPFGTLSEQPGDVTFNFFQGASLKLSVPVTRANGTTGTYSLPSVIGPTGLDLAPGTYSVIANYGQGAGIYPSMASKTGTLVVGLASSATALAVNPTAGTGLPTGIRFGQLVDITSTVTGTSGLPFGTSSVSLFDGATNLTPTPLAVTGSTPASQTLTTSALSVGPHSLQAKYSGDSANYLASQSLVVPITVTKADTSAAISVASPASAITAAGSPLTLTVVVSPAAYVQASAARPTGTVTFTVAGVAQAPVAVQPDGSASLTITPSLSGSFTASATYSGDNNYLASSTTASASYVVSSLALSLGASNPASVVRGVPVSFSATVSPTAATAGAMRFTFTQGSNVINRDITANTNGVYVLSDNINQTGLDLASGSYSVTASYIPASADPYPAMTSNSSTLNVAIASSATALAVNPAAGPSIPTGIRFGQMIDITSTVTGTNGLTFGTGSVSFFDSTNNLTPTPLAVTGSTPASQTLTTSALSVGSHSLQAKYSGDSANYLASQSMVVPLTISKADTSSSISAVSPASAVTAVGSSLTLRARVLPAAYVQASAAKPTGTVTFVVAGGVQANVAIQPDGTASFTFTPQGSGSFTASASYSGDDNYNGSSAASIPYRVSDLSVNLGGFNPASLTRGAPVSFSATVSPFGTLGEQPGNVTFNFFQGAALKLSVPVSRASGATGTYSLSSVIGPAGLDLAAGSYTVVANYSQGAGIFPSMNSASATLNVALASNSTSIAVNPTAGPNLPTGIRFGQSIDISTTVTGTSGLPFGTGSVSLFDGIANLTPPGLPVIGAGSPSGSVTQNISTSSLSVGSHNLQARYSGDSSNYLPSQSVSMPLLVSKADTSSTISVVSPAFGITTAGSPITLRAFVSPAAYVQASAARPTGTVTFTVAGVGQNPVAVQSDGSASITFIPQASGSFIASASYSGDANYNISSTSTSASYTVASLNFSPLASSVIQRGSLLTLSAAVNPSTGNNATPSGTVNFVIPGATETLIASVPAAQAVNGVYATTIDTGNPSFNLPVGAYNLVARYVPAAGDAYPALGSAGQSLAVNRQATSLAASVASSPVIYGVRIPLQNASIAPGLAGSTISFAPGSTVALFASGFQIASIPFSDLNRSLSIPPSTPPLSPGSYALQLRYAGDSNYAPATLDVGSLSVLKANPSISLNPASGTNLRSGTPVNIAASLASPAGTAPSGSVQFSINGSPLGSPAPISSGLAKLTYTPTRSGPSIISAQYLGDINYNSANSSVSLRTMPRQPFFAIASQAGSYFMTYDTTTGSRLSLFRPLGASYTGGFRVATGDVNGDGVADLLWTSNSGSFVRIVDGLTRNSLGGLTAFSSSFSRPVNIAVADYNGDGFGDIIATPGAAGVAATVRVFSGKDYSLLLNKSVLGGATGGVSVTGADVNGDGLDEIILTPMSASGPRVQVLAGGSGALLSDFNAFATTSRSGYSLAAADLTGDGKAELVISPASGAQQAVIIGNARLDGTDKSNSVLNAFTPFSPSFTGGARVAFGDDIDGDGIRDIVLASGPGGQSQVRRVSGRNLNAIDSFFAFAASLPERNKGLFNG